MLTRILPTLFLTAILASAATAYGAGTAFDAHGMSPATTNGMPQLPPQAATTIPDSYIVTFKQSIGAAAPLILPADRAKNLSTPVPFGENSTGQSKAELARTLGINGNVLDIYETINAAHIQMSAKEAHKLSLDPRVISVEPDVITTAMANYQLYPGWGLDRLDSNTPTLNYSYGYTNNGAGQTIYI